MSQEPQRIALALIRLEASVWPRKGFDHDRVDDFAELYKAQELEVLPPVVIIHDGAGQYLVCDGHHRIAALHKLGADAALTVTEALPSDQSPEQYAFEYAVQTAAHAAKPLTRAERNAAVERFLDEPTEWSDRRIADICGVSHQTVGRRREGRSNGPAGSGGRTNSGASRHLGDLEAAEHLIRALEKVRWVLGLSDLFGGRNLAGERLARVLANVHGESALERAREYQHWITEAIAKLAEEAQA
jgi:ParB-like chromosome segregation protein Spo0J